MSKFAFRIVYLDIEICRLRYFCVQIFFWTPYFAILAKTLVTRLLFLLHDQQILKKPPSMSANGDGHRHTFWINDDQYEDLFSCICCRLYGPDAGINFGSWFILAFPNSVLSLIMAWVLLQAMFLGPK